MAADTSHWGLLTAALRTSRPQVQGDQDYPGQYHDPALVREFMHSKTALSMGAALAIAEKFPGSATARSSNEGFGYTGAQCRSWMSEVGFRDSYVEPLVWRDSIVGLK
jgi:hypothetical protein